MGIRGKTILLVGACLLAISGLAFAVLSRHISARFLELERSETLLNIERLENAIADREDDLLRLLDDYATPDGSYDLADTRSPESLVRHYTYESMREQTISSALYFTQDGEFAAGVVADHEARTARTAPIDLVETMTARRLLLSQAAQNGAAGGFDVFRGVVHQVVVRPVRFSSGDGRPRGFLALTREINRHTIADSARQFKIQLRIVRLRIVSFDPVSSVQDPVAYGGDDALVGNIPLANAAGKNIAAVQVVFPRPLWQEGRRLIAFIGAVLCTASCVLLLSLLSALHIVLVGPLQRLTMKVQGWKEKPSEVLVNDPRERGDEIGKLAGVVRGLVVALEERSLACERGRESAEAGSRAKSEFLANMSHELRTPMNAILGMAELAAESATNPEQREQLESVREAGQSLLQIVNDILDLARLEAGHLEMIYRDFNLEDEINRIVKMFTGNALGKDISIYPHYAEDVPRLVHGEPVRLRQILTNLIGNALKFTPTAGVVIVAVLRDPYQEGCIELVVADSGIGIKEEDQVRLFQYFSQVDSSASRRQGGTGLGLAISKRLAQKMGGRIWVRSICGVGSAFHVSLPFRKAAAQAPAPAPDRHSDWIGAGTVLVVEDNVVNQKLVCSILKRLGIETQLAHDGAQALQAIKAGHYDLVLMDCQMPVLDGFAATKLIRAHEAVTGTRVPIAALTAHAMRGDKEECLAAGMDDYLAKPIDRGELLRLLRRWLLKTGQGAPPR